MFSRVFQVAVARSLTNFWITANVPSRQWAPPAGGDNEAIKDWLSPGNAPFYDCCLWPTRGKQRQLSGGHRLRAARQTRFRERIPSESLLHGERFAHGRLRFRMGRLGARVVDGAAGDRQMDACLQL